MYVCMRTPTVARTDRATTNAFVSTTNALQAQSSFLFLFSIHSQLLKRREALEYSGGQSSDLIAVEVPAQVSRYQT